MFDFVVREKDLPFLLGITNRGFLDILFAPSEENPPIEEQLYLYMKRFRTQPSEFFKMERSMRLSIYKREYKLLMEEYDEVQEMKNNKNKGQT